MCPRGTHGSHAYMIRWAGGSNIGGQALCAVREGRGVIKGGEEVPVSFGFTVVQIVPVQ
jgi:hypothetical protein